jgi:DNA repair exonuclease SbcCD ATPase subunit
MSNIAEIVSLLNTPRDQLTEEQQLEIDNLTNAFQENQKSFAEAKIAELKEKAEPLVKELTEVKNAIKDLEEHEEIQQLMKLREELKIKNKEIKQHKEASDVCRSLTVKTKEEKELATELRILRKDIKALGGDFKIPIASKKKSSKSSKRSKSPKIVISKRRRNDDEPVAASPQELPPSPKSSRTENSD